jgi:RNA polymerase sigma factor (sigma-70 family)
MYQIARNARLDHFRKQRPETSWSAEMEPRVPAGDPAQKKQEAALLHQALMQLPEEKREVLVLSRFQELKHDEIARLVGCDVGAVKVRVHRALQELKQVFYRLQSDRPAKAADPRSENRFATGSSQ